MSIANDESAINGPTRSSIHSRTSVYGPEAQDMIAVCGRTLN